MGQPAAGGAMGDTTSGDTGNRPGGGIGNPIGTPDPLTKYKWWILGGLTLLLAAAAAFLLRRQGALAAGGSAPGMDAAFEARPFPGGAPSTAAPVNYTAAPISYAPAPPSASYAAPPATGNAALLNSLKDELFALEREKVSGTISAVDYAEAKAGLEAVLKRALRNG
jgi:hypothetical protein